VFRKSGKGDFPFSNVRLSRCTEFESATRCGTLHLRVIGAAFRFNRGRFEELLFVCFLGSKQCLLLQVPREWRTNQLGG
jgi:hypothetical protein